MESKSRSLIVRFGLSHANVRFRISDQTRYWGQGVAGYGNDIKDGVAVGGSRVSTAGNPLGMAGMGAGKATAPGDKGKGPTGGKGGTASNPLGMS